MFIKKMFLKQSPVHVQSAFKPTSEVGVGEGQSPLPSLFGFLSALPTPARKGRDYGPHPGWG